VISDLGGWWETGPWGIRRTPAGRSGDLLNHITITLFRWLYQNLFNMHAPFKPQILSKGFRKLWTPFTFDALVCLWYSPLHQLASHSLQRFFHHPIPLRSVLYSNQKARENK
jgi:hypothetical protein